MSEEVLLKKEGGIVTIALNRPEVMNAFSLSMATQLKKKLGSLQGEKDLRVVVIQGTGRAFSAGGDIKQMAQTKDFPRFFDQISQEVHEAVLTIRKLPQAVIALCNGPVSGVAFGLVTACDLRIASTEATFNAGTTGLGLAPNGGLTYFLPRLIGQGRATQMLLTAEKISAQIALEWGLVNDLAAPEQLPGKIEGWTEKLATKAPFAHKKVKELFTPDEDGLAAHLDRERRAISTSADTQDFKEGVAAFLEKRPPQFHGK